MRATHALLHGDIGAALRFNPIAVVALILLGWMLVSWGCEAAREAGWTRRVVCDPLMTRWAATATAVVVPVFWVARNVPQFRWLAPPA